MKLYSDISRAIWLWLFPITYLAHIAEEYWGGEGFPAHISRVRGANLAPAHFLVMTGVALVLMVAGIILAQKFNFPQWLQACLGTIVLVNGLSHTTSSVMAAGYEPGLISGALIWIPLGILTLIRLKGSMRARRYFAAIGVGLLIHGVVSLLALRGGKLFGA